MSDRILDLRVDFDELRTIFYKNYLWYGDNTKIITSEDIPLREETDDFSVLISFFRVCDKQLYVNITVTGEARSRGGEYHDNYFFTWYDHRPFEVATLNGQPLSEDAYNELLNILKLAGFKSNDEKSNGFNHKESSCEAIYITRKDRY